jgi:YD repeat-containing protein
VTPVTQTKTGPDGVTITTLDGLGRTIRVQRGDSAGVDATTSYTDTVYAPCACSPLGKIQQVSQPYAPGSTPAWTVYSYDGVGRTLSVMQPDGASATAYSYSGNQSTVTDPAGNWKTFASDVLGNLTTVVEPDPANQPSGTLTTNYTYDWMNHVSQVSMSRAGTTQTRTFVYNDAGLLTSATNPENGTVTYTYNADNTLNTKQDAKGQVKAYGYDAYKRVAIIWTYPNGQSSPEDVCQRVSYGWDGSWNPNYALHGYDAGRLTGAYYGPEDSAGNSCIAGTAPTRYQEWYEYWPDGQIMSRSLTMSRGGKTSTIAANYLYNNAGNISEAVYPLATPFTQSAPSLGTVYFNTSYDSMGRPVSMTDSNYGWNWAQGAQYDYASRLTSLQYMAGAPGGTPAYTTETMAYNTNGQMVSQNWSTPSSS